MALKNQHDFKGWGENQRIMLHDMTRFFYHDPLLKNGFRAPVTYLIISSYFNLS